MSFAIGPACLLVDVVTGSHDAFLLFLGVATVYGYYHVVRQHYGFLALYKTRTGDQSRSAFHLDKWCLYLGCWLPYGYFVVSHPRARALLGLVPDAPPPAASIAAIAIAWVSAIAIFATVTLADRKRAVTHQRRRDDFRWRARQDRVRHGGVEWQEDEGSRTRARRSGACSRQDERDGMRASGRARTVLMVARCTHGR
ncbi:MAG: hypothetical protein HY698_17370 [Deltaproteobacteria bacterium]|nr:hypothetical protein [Deltaproteobacteria bacterium]